jgi:glycosyltransferase involved in cell wall biosynthesis
MTDLPLVTIVTPSYNQAQFIQETIESVLSQGYPNLEYIIMDGASTDGTAEVVKPYLDRLTFISEPDRGQSHAINKGFAMARGEIVAWLNSDDVFLPGAIMHAVEAFLVHPHAAVVYGEGYQIDIAGTVTGRFPHTQRFDLWRLTHMSDFILQQTVFFRKSALEAVGPLREDLHYIMDWDILIRLGKRFEFVYIPEFLGCLREYETAKTFSGGAKRAREIHEVLRGHTNKALPAGYVVYGLDSYSQIWTAQIRRWPNALRRLKPRLESLVLKVAHRIIGRVNIHTQGLYTDGWMSKKAHLMLRSGKGEILFTGHLPSVPQLKGQLLTITCKDYLCVRQELEPGDFTVRFPAPPNSRTEPPEFSVTFSKWFVPKGAGDSHDARALSIRFFDLNWADEPSDHKGGTNAAGVNPASRPSITS